MSMTKYYIRTLKTLVMGLMLLPIINLSAQQVLKPKEAFPIEVYIQNDVIQINHQIENGYYLYKDKIGYRSLDEKILLEDYVLPSGIEYEDEFFGKTEIYRDAFSVYITITKGLESISYPFQIEVDSQGCADIGLCYPPQTWIIDVQSGSNLEASIFATSNVSEETRLGSVITESNLLSVFLIFVGLGFILAFTPCHLPTIPILSSIIIGQTDQNKTKAFALSLTYVFGMAVTYSLFGTLTALAGNQMQALFTMSGFIIFMAILFIFLGLSMLGLYNMQMPSFLMNQANNMMNNQKGGSYIGVFIIGILSAFLVTACVAPPLVATLMVIGQSGDIFRGIVALSALSIGLGIPLMVIGLTASKWLPKSGKYLDAIKELFGFIMIGLSIWILNPLINETFINQLYLIVIASMIVFFLKYLDHFSASIKRVIRVTVAGFTLVILGFNLTNIELEKDTDRFSNQFDSIETESELNLNLEKASKENKATMIYFTADWCVSCRRLEKNTFSDKSLQAKINNINAIKIDLTDNSIDDQFLIKSYSIFGPPTILFFDSNGVEQKSKRKIGVVDAEILITEINALENQI